MPKLQLILTLALAVTNLSLGQDPTFSARFETEPDGKVMLVWPTKLGRQYVVKESTDLVTWQDLPQWIPGLGTEARLHFFTKEINAQNPANPPSAPSTPYVHYNFLLGTLPDGKTLVQWYQAGAPQMALVEQDWRTVQVAGLTRQFPQFLWFTDESTLPRVGIGLMLWPVRDQSIYNSLPALAPEAAARLAALTSRAPAIKAKAVEILSIPTVQQPPSDPPPPNARRFVKVVEMRPDSDGDGLFDDEEIYDYRTNPWSLDTDGDGFSDGYEVADGSDPNSAASTPSGPPPTAGTPVIFSESRGKQLASFVAISGSSGSGAPLYSGQYQNSNSFGLAPPVLVDDLLSPVLVHTHLLDFPFAAFERSGPRSVENFYWLNPANVSSSGGGGYSGLLSATVKEKAHNEMAEIRLKATGPVPSDVYEPYALISESANFDDATGEAQSPDLPIAVTNWTVDSITTGEMHIPLGESASPVVFMTRPAVHGKALKFWMMPIGLDVNSNDSLADATDGLYAYLPGYQRANPQPPTPQPPTPKLHTGADFQSASYTGPQGMQLIANFSSSFDVKFEILDTTAHEGYCGNGTDPSLVANPTTPANSNDDDFSFEPNRNQRNAVTAVDIGNGNFGKKAVIYCKDYGACCTIKATITKGTKTADIIFTIPTDKNGDKLSDYWQDQQILAWNAQFKDTRKEDQAERNTMKPGATGKYPDKEMKDPDGAGNGDGGRDLPDMADEGDGLTVFDEYRGFIFDGGPNATKGKHQRLSIARKELLVECSEATGIKDPANNGAGANQDIQAYDFDKMMEASLDFYREPNRGAAIDLYWCRDDFAPLLQHYSYTAAPTVKYDAYFENGTATYFGAPSNPDPTATGAYTITFDSKWRGEAPIPHDNVYKMEALLQRTRNPKLEKFIKLFLGHRRAKVTNQRTLLIDPQLAATNDDNQNRISCGSFVFVSGIADEGLWAPSPTPYNDNGVTFKSILYYTVAHELGHLIIDAHSVSGWSQDEHTNSTNGSLMAFPANKDLSILRFTAEEIGKIDLKKRASVIP